MYVTTSHEAKMAHCADLVQASGIAAPPASRDAAIWINGDLTDQERSNVAVVNRFWNAWKALPFDMSALRACFHPDVSVRTGWRGEGVAHGREEALKMYAEEIQRQTDHDEVTEIRFPIVVAKGPVLFHTWVWIARSARLGYHIERPMAAFYLITDGLIERWDSYCTGPESAPDYVGGDGPDGL